jgi:outer membrane protein OmpA-like peptidoglycan-associated protein
MKLIFGFLILTAAGLSFDSLALAQAATIDAPGVHVETDRNGSIITAPGVSIKAPAGRDIADAAEPSGVKNGADYINAVLPGMDFSNKNLANANFSNAKLVGANFSGAVLTGAQFTNADLSQANLTGANLTGASFANAIFSGADLSNADFSIANLSNAVMDGALVVGTKFDHAMLTNVDMGTVVHKPSARTEMTDAKTIRAALKPDPANPKAPRKIDLTVNFDFNSDRLTVDGAKQVKEIAAALDDPALQQASIVVEGHTDNVGTDAYNQKLSERRATRVLQTLTSEYHVSGEHLSARGFGESQPVASNDSDLGRAKNRRVTLVSTGR